MPKRPQRLRPAGHRPPVEARRDYDRRRREAKPWRGWYSLAAWQRRRARQLRRQPLCEMCLAKGKTVAASVADHVEPHRGDWELFIRGDLQSLCEHCHNSVKQAEERAGAR